VGSAHLEGEILYNGDPIDCGKYLVGKLATYSDEKELHSAILTVRETLEFAWKMTTGGHHSYNIAKDKESAAVLDEDDDHLVKVSVLANCVFLLFVAALQPTFLRSVVPVAHIQLLSLLAAWF